MGVTKTCTHVSQRQKSLISFSGLYNLLYFSVRKRPWHALFFFILNIDHFILFAAKICILLLILHGLNYKNLEGYPHFSTILRYCLPGGYSIAHSTFVYQQIFFRV